MTRDKPPSAIVRTGHLAGLRAVYDQFGHLVRHDGETVLREAKGWDMEVCMGWRRFLPKVLFEGFNGPVSSALYITNERVVLIRDIDVWRETKGDMSLLGVPGGVAKAVDLRRLAALGAREYCEIHPKDMRVVRVRRLERLRSWLDFYLIGNDGLKYEVLVCRMEGEDEETTSLLESQFRR